MPSPSDNLRPMLAARADEPFDSDDHLFELKWAGIRALAYVEQARLTLISQSGRDITAWFPELAGMAGQVRDGSVVLDGEIVALGDDGEPDLRLIAARLAGGDPEDGVVCLYQACDLLYANGASLMDLPLLQRKESLARVLANAGPAVAVEYVSRDGIALFEAAAERRLPGTVAKASRSLYSPGVRSGDWLEVPVYESGWFVVGGYALGVGKEAKIASLLIGDPAMAGRLRYVGQVQSTLPADVLEPVLAGLTADVNPFLSTPNLLRLVYWTRPELVCETKFARREPDGRLRFPLLVTLRPDLSVSDLREGGRQKRAPRG